MANEEHLQILKQGGEAWNQWRRDNPEIRPNLRGAYLIGYWTWCVRIPWWALAAPTLLRRLTL